MKIKRQQQLKFWIFLATWLIAPVAFSNPLSSNTKISSGVFYATGQSQTLGSPDSQMFSIPLMISWSYSDYHASITTAFLDINNRYPTFTSQTQGFGDTTLSVAVDLTNTPWLTIKLREKIATGDANKGLSTGKNDTSVQLEYFDSFGANLSGFATLGYKWTGKVSGLQMKDSTFSSIGIGKSLAQQINLGLSLDYYQSSFISLNDQIGGTVFINKAINKSFTVSGFTSYDNTETTSFGLTFTTQF